MSLAIDGIAPTSTVGLRRRSADRKFNRGVLNSNFDIVDREIKKFNGHSDFDPRRLRRANVAFFDADPQITLDWNNSYIRRMGFMCFFEISFKFKDRFSAGSSGNMGNRTLGTIRNGWRPKTVAHLSTASSGRGAVGWANSGGLVRMSAVMSTAVGDSNYIEKTETFSLMGFYPLQQR